VEGSIPNGAIKREGYWCGFGNNPETDQPMTTSEWLDRLAPKALVVLAAGVCCYGGIHAMAATRPARWCPTISVELEVEGGIDRVRARVAPRTPTTSETILYLLYQATAAPMIPSTTPCPQWLFGATVHGGCDRRLLRAGRLRQEYGSPKCIVKLGCWGPVVNCSVPKRGWINGVGGCPNVGGICIGCTMPGFRQVHAVHGRATGVESLDRGERLVRHRDPRAATHHPQDRRRGTEVAKARQGPPHWLQARVEVEMAIKKPDANGLVEMAWDPITRIVGSLGIYTKIDFGKGKVAECHSTSSIFRGYSIFMKGKDPRDPTSSPVGSGICGDNHATCSCCAQNGLRRAPTALGEQS
jgi:hypothetical protein